MNRAHRIIARPVVQDVINAIVILHYLQIDIYIDTPSQDGTTILLVAVLTRLSTDFYLSFLLPRLSSLFRLFSFLRSLLFFSLLFSFIFFVSFLSIVSHQPLLLSSLLRYRRSLTRIISQRYAYRDGIKDNRRIENYLVFKRSYASQDILLYTKRERHQTPLTRSIANCPFCLFSASFFIISVLFYFYFFFAICFFLFFLSFRSIVHPLKVRWNSRATSPACSVNKDDT